MRSCPLCRCIRHSIFMQVEHHILLACRVCGFVYHGNPPEISEEEQAYEHYFAESPTSAYGPDVSDADLRRLWFINQRRLEFIKSLAVGNRLLDVGCGRGFFLHHAQFFNFKPYGVDLSRTAAEYAAKAFGLSVAVANLETQPIHGAFDVITLWHVLEHFHEPLRVLGNLKTLLSPRGVLFIEVPNLNDIKFRLLPPSQRWRGGNHPRLHRSFFTPKTLRAALENAGFQCKFYSPAYSPKKPKAELKRILNRFGIDSVLNVVVYPSS